MTRLVGRVAIVTGASPNIGGAIAAGLARAGARVVCSNLDADAARAAASRIEAEGGAATVVVGDVTDPGHAGELIRAAFDTFGGLDIVVNNAMKFDYGGVLSMDVASFRAQLEVGLVGTFLCTQAAARSMVERGVPGSIVNILSTAAWQGQPGNVGYSTAKSGLINFTRSAAMELARYDIRVNGLTPTVTVSDDPAALARLRDDPPAPGGYPMDFVGQFPLRRLPTADDYAGAAVFLASDDAAMVTGSHLVVDGGASGKYWPWQPSYDD